MTAPGPPRTDFETLDFYRRELWLLGLNTTTLTVNQVAATLGTALSEIERARLRAPESRHFTTLTRRLRPTVR